MKFEGVGIRLTIITILTFLGLGLVAYRIFSLAIIQNKYFSGLAQSQKERGIVALPRRGDIFMQDKRNGDLFVAATLKNFPYLYVIPKEIRDTNAALEKIQSVFPDLLDEKSLKSIIENSEGEFSILQKRITSSQAKTIASFMIDGVGVGQERERYYPAGGIASHVLGFLGFDGDARVGQYGVEGFYDAQLRGMVDKDFFTHNLGAQSIQDGDSLILALDVNIQQFAEELLARVVKKWNAEGGSILVQNPRNGSLFAMVSTPSFNPNHYSDFSLKLFINPNIQETFEPGSTMKGITMAAGIDTKSIEPDTVYYDSGEERIAGHVIRNYDLKSHQYQTMTQVLEKSLNTGAIFAQQRMGDGNFLRYLEGFGFGKKTGIDLFGEVNGDITNLYSKRPINFATASFGQGISVTPLQLINAYSVIANGGTLYRPYVVKEILSPYGLHIKKKDREIIAQPISEETAHTLQAMLVSAVENGFDRSGIAGYDVAAKTGTAQVPGPEGGYSEDFIHDIVGFAPAFDAQFIVFILLDRPKGVRFASTSLSPVLREMIQFLLNYFEIPPNKQP